MALDFPNAPTNGQQFTGVGGAPVWQWDGTKWVAASAGGAVLEAPQDGTYYTRRNAVWTDVNNDAVAYAVTQALTSPQQAVALRNIGASQNYLINGKLVETHAANAATFAIKGLDGNDPSSTNPVLCIFPDASVLTITAALSLTIPATATLATANAQPFRIWFVLFNDAGTARIGVTRRTNGSNATPFVINFDGRGIASATTPVANAVAIYANATISNKPFRVIGYADYESGLATAGTWNASPTRIILANPQTPLPGSVLQEYTMATSAQITVGGSTAVTSSAITLVLTPFSIIHPVRVSWGCDILMASGSGNADSGSMRIYRNDATALFAAQNVWGYGANNTSGYYAGVGIDFPSTSAALRYRISFALGNGAAGMTMYCPWTGGMMSTQELMV
jgi:hypothetical protein